MKMSLWQFYQNEIDFFERKTDELLTETIIQESKIERKRQQQLHVTKKNIDKLATLITTTLKAIAIVKTYVNFQILQIQPTNQNNELFFIQREHEFIKLLVVFLSKIKNENGNGNGNGNGIDFTINR